MKEIIGIIETKGLVAAVAALDAVLKNTDASFLGFDFIGNGIVIAKFSASSVSIDYVLKEAQEKAEKYNGFIASTAIDSSNEALRILLSQNKSSGKKNLTMTENKSGEVQVIDDTSPKVNDAGIQKNKKNFSIGNKKSVKQKIRSIENSVSHLDTIERLKREALGNKDVNVETVTESRKLDIAATDVESMNVHELRHFVRSIQNFPIKGRQISRANRNELISYYHLLQG